jgi:hypothetical protein
MYHYKDHFIADLEKDIDDIISKHHRRKVKKAMKQIHIEKCDDPLEVFDSWWKLYQNLIMKYEIKGIRAFSKNAFKVQLSIPGITVFKAIYMDKIVGIQLWFDNGNVAYSHLSAYSDEGYDLSVSYAIRYFSIEYFKEKNTPFLSMGAGSGIGIKKEGLTHFKKGWSTGTKKVYFCGKINNKKRYNEIFKKNRLYSNNYFPPYRKGDFS